MGDTNNLDLTKPEYLSDGEAAVASMNENMDRIDALIGNIVTYEGEMLVYKGEMVISIL